MMGVKRKMAVRGGSNGREWAKANQSVLSNRVVESLG